MDEYDKPILNVIDKPEMAIANRANRDYLREFYDIIKGSASNVRFAFVTGVSMFSRVSLRLRNKGKRTIKSYAITGITPQNGRLRPNESAYQPPLPKESAGRRRQRGA